MHAFMKFVTQDWYFAIPMFAMSIFGATLVIWRWLLDINGNTNLSEFLPTFQQALEKEGVDGALKLCKSRDDIIPNKLFVPALETHKQGHGLAAVRRSLANAIELEIAPDLNYLLPTILAIAKIATMVGLLGTVISMIGTFSDIARAQSGASVGGHADKIGLALFATALGLVTAIPLVFAHVLFKAWASKFELRMKSASQKLVMLLQAQKSASRAAAAPAAGTAAIKTTR